MEPLDTKAANKAALGAPGTIRIGGNVYLASQPTKSDFGTLNKFLLDFHKKKSAKLLAEISKEVANLPADIKAAVMKEVAATAVGNSTPDANALGGLLLENEAIAFWTWHLCRKNHPELTLAEVTAAVNDPSNPAFAGEMMADMLEATSMKDVVPNLDGGNGSSS
jgi:hypothetical protein